MIISHGRKYVFVHIPKTGGTAMAEALEERAMADDILIGDTEKAKRRKGRLRGLQAAGRVWKHSTLNDLKGVIEPADLAEMMVFTLVRNPWDRVVSYYHWLRAQTFDHVAVQAAKGLSFGDFVMNPEVADGLQRWPYARYVEGAKTPVFIRLEHFNDDIMPVVDHLGFELNLRRTNASNRRRDWRTYYSNREYARIKEICEQDLKQFGYDF